MGTETWNLAKMAKSGGALRSSRNVRESAGNAFYSVAEYIAQPAAMLLAAPFLVHRLGLAQCGSSPGRLCRGL